MNEQKISCPNCQHQITFDVYALLQGSCFICTVCNAKIQLAGESKEMVTGSIQKFKELKKNVLKNQTS